MPKRSTVISLAVITFLGLLLLSLGYPSVIRLSQDRSDQNRGIVLSGVARTGVARTAAEPGNVLVVATKASDQPGEREIAAFSRLTSSAAFALVVPANDHYWLTAFADSNGNGRWDGDEEGGELGGESGLLAAADHALESLEIKLDQPPGPDGELSIPSHASDAEAIQIRTGRLSTLDDAHLSSENGRRGLWKPILYSQEIGFGIDFLEPYDPEKTGVLFINGAAGSPQDWRPAIEALDRTRFQPWVLVYASGSPLREMVDGTLGVLRELNRVHRVGEVILVAHSMGGLIARAVADQLGSPGSQPQVNLLVTASTPFDGHAAAGLGVRYAPAVLPAWRDLEPGSAFLTALSKSSLRGRVPHVVLFSFGGASWLMSDSNDGTVSLASQLPPWIQQDAALQRGFAKDHVEILSDPEMLALLAGSLNPHSLNPPE